MKRGTLVGVSALLAVGGLVACSSTDDASGHEVTVTMSEFRVDPKPGAVDAGTVTVTADNVGGEKHELVIIRGAGDLPTKADGSVNEKAVEDRIIGEIEGVKAQSEKTKAFELSAGEYTLICNIVSETGSGESEPHYDLGMKATLTVN